MTLSLIVLLTVAAVYAGMKFGFQDAYLKSQLKSANAESADVFKSVTAEEQKQIFNFYSQLSNIHSLLDTRGKGILYLDLLEKNTLKTVTYSNIGVIVADKEVNVDLDGRASSYGAIVQQMDLYKKMPGVKDVKLSGARVGGQAADGVLFSMKIIVNR
ncbi:TPA: hypothetical protein DDZ49_04555 [Candidatus Wolfebacteria bacterium]|nr:hypothetical protein [Candidatus Wolfebacteria bacterium]HAS95062.1 hypothetical protein [Candidatus Wolfebacteria bacterium]HBD17831.1 hypothetical protein [Candidatus Wolfebacteria bacterium]HBN87401.1 hypothetical protein [Candidatus Wolfebacteria bacterium]HCM52754.1 hypothetical protein [Candidatus Wolfebacteria bacterium]